MSTGGIISSPASFRGYVITYIVLHVLTQPLVQIVEIIANAQNPINVIRPATSILKRLVEADPRFGAESATLPSSSNFAASTEEPPSPLPGSVYRYGFDSVWRQLQRSPNMLSVVISRLNMAESGMALGG